MFDIGAIIAKITEFGLSDADLIMLLVVLLIILTVTEKISSFLYNILKRFLGFIIIALSVLAFVLYAKEQIFIQQDPYFLGLAAVGGGISLIILVNTFMSLIKNYTKEVPELQDVPVQKTNIEQQAIEKVQAAAVITPEGTVEWRDFTNTIQDKSFLNVLSYSIVAQFGVFSGVTIAPPTPETGFVFFCIFVLVGFIFIKGAYSSYGKGISHLILGVIANLCFSIILGHFWANIAIETLLSFLYFNTYSLVAALTGTAVGLFMSTKK